jgi:hypothetical protein
MPKVLVGGTAGLCSAFRRHLIAGLVLHGQPPVRFFGHLFSDCLVLLSQLELPGVGALAASAGSSGAGSGDEELGDGLILSPGRTNSPRSARANSATSKLPRISGRERKRVLQRMTSDQTLAQLNAASRGKRHLLFRIEKVIPLEKITVELQLLNRGFSVDGYEFSVEGGRNNLLRWYDAFRLVDVCNLVDTSAGKMPLAREDPSQADLDNADDELLALMESEFCIYDTSVVRTSSNDDQDEQTMADLLRHVDENEEKAGHNGNASSGGAEALRSLFLPPPEDVSLSAGKATPDTPRRGRLGSSSLIAPLAEGEIADDASDLARMLRSTQYTLRILRETK